MEAIIISGLPAVGKTETAKQLSAALHIKDVNGGDILKEMARERGYMPSGEGWWDSSDGIRFLKEREGDPQFDKEVDRRMLALIEKGDVVVASWTMPWLSKHGFKVWLDASTDVRAHRMSMRDGTSVEICRKVIEERDRLNYELYEKLYGIKLGKDKKPFDVIINTDNLAVSQVADAIMQKMRD